MTTDSKLQEQWEKKLEACGLGVVQPLTDNSEGELATLGTGSPRRSKGPDATSADYAQLRRKVDGGDQFMNAHQIKKIRSVEREIPSWATNDEAVRRLITTSFPAWNKSQVSRKRAGRWVRFITLYYRMQLPRQIVAKELGMSKIGVRDLIRNLNRAAEGRSVRGNKPRKIKNC